MPPPTVQEIQAAIDRVKQGESAAGVARSSPLKRSTLFKYLKMLNETGTISIQKRGPKKVIPVELEADLVTWIAAMQRSDWPVERYEVLQKAGQNLTQHCGVPRTVSRGWFQRFEQRQPDLSARISQNLSKERNSVTKEGIIMYLNELVKGCLGFACTSSDVYNVDETSFKTKGKTNRVIAIRGSKNVWKGESTDAYHMTIVAAVAADGTALPPAFILPGQSCATNALDSCKFRDALVSTSPKAWMTSDLFDAWLECFGEWKLKARHARPAVLVMDNCSSHLSFNSLAICEAYGIFLVRLPPNATHVLQPLDVAVFRTFKRQISVVVTEKLQAMNTTNLPRHAAIAIAGMAFNAVFRPVGEHGPGSQAVINGFRTCGILPMSLPKMLCRLEAAKSNGVKAQLGMEAWLRTMEHAREEVLTLPPKPTGRKRVKTDSEWFSRDGLYTAATRGSKHKK